MSKYYRGKAIVNGEVNKYLEDFGYKPNENESIQEFLNREVKTFKEAHKFCMYVLEKRAEFYFYEHLRRMLKKYGE
jgi:hypothetical protein